MSMGFSAEVARHALLRYANCSERALDWLLNVGEEAAATAAGVSFPGAAAALQHFGRNSSVFRFFPLPPPAYPAPRSTLIVAHLLHSCRSADTTRGGSAACGGGTAAVTSATVIHAMHEESSDWMARLQVFQLDRLPGDCSFIPLPPVKYLRLSDCAGRKQLRSVQASEGFC
jgi:hypothetical protein